MSDGEGVHTFDFDEAGFTPMSAFDPALLGGWVLRSVSGSVYIVLIRPDEVRLLRRPRHLWHWVDDATGETIRLDGRWLTVTEIVEIAIGARATFMVDTRQPGMPPRTLRSTPLVELLFRPAGPSSAVSE